MSALSPVARRNRPVCCRSFLKTQPRTNPRQPARSNRSSRGFAHRSAVWTDGCSTKRTRTTWRNRIRATVKTGSFKKMRGTVEVDETFIGGSADFMRKKVKKAKGIGRVYMTKTAVMALLEHAGEKGKSRVRAKLIKSTKTQTSKAVIAEMQRGTHFCIPGFLPSWRGEKYR